MLKVPLILQMVHLLAWPESREPSPKRTQLAYHQDGYNARMLAQMVMPHIPTRTVINSRADLTTTMLANFQLEAQMQTDI